MTECESKEQTIKIFKNLFVTTISGLEFFLIKYPQFNLFNLRIKDLTQMIISDMEKYTPIFEALYDKYEVTLKKKSLLGPEFKFIATLILDIIIYHLSHSMFGDLFKSKSSDDRIIAKLLSTVTKN